jgi:hypothetical protein
MLSSDGRLRDGTVEFVTERRSDATPWVPARSMPLSTAVKMRLTQYRLNSIFKVESGTNLPRLWWICLNFEKF